MKDILVVRQPESGDWSCVPGVWVCGNQTVVGFRERLEQSLLSQSDKPWDFYLWRSEGKQYDLDNQLLEVCDRWHLSRYEVCSAPDESKYQAVVILYYEPALELAVAV